MKNALKTVDIKLSYQKKTIKTKKKKTQQYLVQPTMQQVRKNQYGENIHQIN